MFQQGMQIDLVYCVHVPSRMLVCVLC